MSSEKKDIVSHPRYADFKTIRVAIQDNVGIIMFDRPKELNAIGSIDLTEVLNALIRLEEDDEVRIIIVTGSGRAFSAGATLTNPNNKYGVRVLPEPLPEEEHRDPGGPLAFFLENNKKVTIAAINGVAVGLGATMILPMDYRISFKKNKLGWVFTRRGIVPESMSTYYLPRLIGQSRALGLFLSGQVLDTENPNIAPLFYELVDKPEDVLPAALKLAKEISVNCSVPANAAIKALVKHSQPSSEAQHLLDSRALSYFVTVNNVDVKEGLDSFLQKRNPDFKGTTKDAPKWLDWWKKAKI